MKKKVLLTSAITIVLCLCLIAGSTFALFTSTASVNVAVTSGTVNVTATISDLKTWSLGETEDQARAGSFTNGGFAKIEDGKLIIDKMTPGDVVKFTIKVVDGSDVATMFRVSGTSNVVEGKTDLAGALTVTTSMNSGEFTDKQFSTQWISANEMGFTYDNEGNKYCTIEVTIAFPNSSNHEDQNRFQGAAADLQFVVEAVQANGVDGQGNLITE